jgi:hypothetical protein
MAMQVWMSLLCAAMHFGRSSREESMAFAAAEVVFLVAGAAEAGSAESKDPRPVRAVLLRVASIVALAAYGAVNLSAS